MESRNKEIIHEQEIEEKEVLQEQSSEGIPDTEYSESDLIPTEEIGTEEQKIGFFDKIRRCELFTAPFKILCYVFAGSLLVYILSRFITPFAEFWTKYPAQGIRFVMAKVTGWIPFSLAEMLLVSIPVLAIGYLVASTISTRRDQGDSNYYKWLRPLVSLILVVGTLFLAGFGPAYGRNKLADNLGLEQVPVSAEELHSTGIDIGNELKDIVAEIEYDANGASIMPYDYHTLVDKVNCAFEKYAGEAEYISHFSSNPKPIALSKPMTYTHISGVYTFMTGESNINTNYPDFLIPFTMAHEMAHQRGIAREDEANFVAFLVCIGSDDAYIRYSGYANMANYVAAALSGADKAKYNDMLVNRLPKALLKEFISYSLFFEEYRDSTASNVTGAVNNVFLQSQGQSAGTKSYGLVVDLAVAYYKTK